MTDLPHQAVTDDKGNWLEETPQTFYAGRISMREDAKVVVRRAMLHDIFTGDALVEYVCSRLDAIPGDPTTMIETANILAEGPSILKMKLEDALPGPVVAINRAIRARACSYMPNPTHWAMWDNPWANCKPCPSYDWPGVTEPDLEGVTIWCTPQDTEEAERLFPTVKVEAIKSRVRGPYTTFPVNRPCKYWNGYRTINVAIRELVARGAKHIRLFGVDMAGTGAAFSTVPVTKPERRWPHENRMFSMLQADAERSGILLERWKP